MYNAKQLNINRLYIKKEKQLPNKILEQLPLHRKTIYKQT